MNRRKQLVRAHRIATALKQVLTQGSRLVAVGCCASTALLAQPAAAQTYLPSTRIGTAALISPSAADNYYGSVTTSTDGLLLGRPAEIKELARGLRNDPDLIYDFVRNNVEISWTYGLQKGALGAVLDRSGTAFDQSKLMVDLLRESGFTASYQTGVITLSGTQFYDWSGITNATAACQLLSSGGIPAEINGSTSATCAYGSANVSTIKISHAWVSARIGGTDYLFDPSYKPHTFFSGMNLTTATGLVSGQALSDATSGMTSGTNSGVNFIRSLNGSALNSRLTGYGTNLLNYIQTNNPAAAMDEVVGGARIVRYDAPAGGLRQTALPYASTSEHSWTGGIPDQYRTRLQVQIKRTLENQSVSTLVDKMLYVDEIYGRKLVWDVSYASVVDENNRAPFSAALRLTDHAGNGPTIATGTVPNELTAVGNNLYQDVGQRKGEIALNAFHPYAAAASGASTTTGDYMDLGVAKPVFMNTPMIIVHGWGEIGTGLAKNWDTRLDRAVPEPPKPECEACGSTFAASQGDAKREQVAAAWLVQSSLAARLHASIAKSVFTLHHALGVTAGDTLSRVYFANNPYPNSTSIADNFDRIDVDAAFSLTSVTNDAATRRAAVFAVAETMEALEGSVVGQAQDLVDTTSVATRFEWGNQPPGAEDLSGGYGARRFYAYTSVNASQASSLTVVEGATTNTNTSGAHWTEPPNIHVTEFGERRNRVAATVASYASAGFDVVASEEAFLGPGQRSGFPLETATNIWSHYPSRQRGGALVATRYSGGEPVEVAHISIGYYFISKGGGGGVQATQQEQYDPAKAADALKARFVDNSEAVGVDLKAGSVTYEAPAKIEIGNGDFPYKLSASLVWRGGNQTTTQFGFIPHTEPQTPWTTNWHNSLSISSSGLEALGTTDARAAAGVIAAFFTQQDIYRAAASTQRDVAGVLVGAWLSKQISGNAVTVALGPETRQFVRQVNGQWLLPGPAGFATLTQSGVRTTTLARPCTLGSTTPIAYTTTRGWDYSGMSFQVTNAQGDVQNFAYWNKVKVQEGGPCAANMHGFRMTNWVFPQGVTVNFVYQASTSTALDDLVEVNNSLGRRIVFAYNIYHNVGGFNNGLSGADLRAVSITRDPSENIVSITDPSNATTRFETVVVGERHRLNRIFDADDAAVASIEYTYDTLDNVKEARDAVALQSGGRGPYQFFLANGLRGEREDPAGGRYAAVYDQFGHPIRFIDEISRVTKVEYDGRGRITKYIYPELDEERFQYDARNNTTQLRRVAKPGSNQTDLVIDASWNATWNKPDWIRDPRTNQTDFVYKSSGLGASLLQTATRPAPTSGAARPVYSFTYGPFGRVATTTDPTGLVVSNSYNATNGNLNSSTLDPTGINATTSFTYDAIGDALTTTDPRANVVEAAYDAMRRPTVTKHHNGALGTPLLAAERINYDILGQQTSKEGGTAFSGTNITAWLTRETKTYTPTGKELTVTNGANNTTTNAYDAADRVLQVTDPAQRVIRFEYDLAGQTLREIRGYGSALQQDYARYTYTPNGLQATVRDANNNRSTFVYDSFDRLCRLYFPAAQIGQNASNGGAAGIQPCAGAADGDFESYAYDANSNRTSLRLRSGETIAFQFDTLNREIIKDIPGDTATDVYTSYDDAGRKLSARFASTSGQGIVYGYDTAKRVSSETSFGKTVSFGYDPASNRNRLTYPDSNYIEYTYDAMNRMEQVRENGATSGIGVLATYSYDALSRRSTLSRAGGLSALTSYEFDTASRLINLTQNFSGSSYDASFGFGYTPASQVNSRSLTNANNAFVYTASLVTKPYVADGLNRYANVGGVAFSYDSRGNLTSDGSRTFTYDLENHLTGMTGPASLQLTYDPLGRLRQSTAGGLTTEFLYDGDRLVAEYNGAALQRRYVHGAGVDEPIIWYEGSDLSNRRWLLADRQGSVIAVADSSGAVSDAYTYSPYGEPGGDNWTGSRFKYTGQTAIPEAKLYHYKARVYDASLGRFLQTDPVGYKDQMNLYAYVTNDPLNNQDSTGLSCTTNQQGKVAACKIDVVVQGDRKLTVGEKNRIEGIYTAVVSQLQSSNKSYTMKVGDKTKTVTSGDLAKALISRNMRVDTTTPPPAQAGVGARTIGNNTTIRLPAVERIGVPFGSVHGERSYARVETMAMVIAHDGLHGTGGPWDGGKGPDQVLGPTTINAFRQAHQDLYDITAAALLGVP